MNPIYEEVTARIVASLEQGVAPWVKPWKPSNKPDANAITGKAYHGINRFILGMQWRPSHEWATFKQWQEKGAAVRKGEKGTHIIFYSPVVRKGEDGEVESAYNMLKTYCVFNAEQVDGYVAPVAFEEYREFEHLEQCEQTMAGSGAAIVYDGGNRAFYRPSTDSIHLPVRRSFITPANFYATAFHELGHWTGHATRLDRKLSGDKGGGAYAYEELIAELTAAFLCEDHGVAGDLRHAGYIDSWLNALKNDNRLIFKAAAAAQKAAALINQGVEPVRLAA